jgi:hypothetical protein
MQVVMHLLGPYLRSLLGLRLHSLPFFGGALKACVSGFVLILHRTVVVFELLDLGRCVFVPVFLGKNFAGLRGYDCGMVVVLMPFLVYHGFLFFFMLVHHGLMLNWGSHILLHDGCPGIFFNSRSYSHVCSRGCLIRLTISHR